MSHSQTTKISYDLFPVHSRGGANEQGNQTKLPEGSKIDEGKNGGRLRWEKKGITVKYMIKGQTLVVNHKGRKESTGKGN